MKHKASSFITQGVGYSKLDGSKNDYKPYLYLIRDKASGEVWFTGTVYNPTTK